MNQAAIAELITIIGNGAQIIAMVEGDSALAQIIKTDTQLAAAAVLNWQSGTATATIIQVLNLLVEAIGTIPQVAPYLGLIDLGIATLEAIIAELPTPTLALPNKIAVAK